MPYQFRVFQFIRSKDAEKISGLVAKNTDWLEVDFAPWKLVFRGRPGTFQGGVLLEKQKDFSNSQECEILL